jgi:hypothetical protein
LIAKEIDMCITDEELDVPTIPMTERSYRRGVCHGVNLVTDLVQSGATLDELVWLCDESLDVRESPGIILDYMGELRGRFVKHRVATSTSARGPREQPAQRDHHERVVAAVADFVRGADPRGARWRTSRSTMK